MSEKEIVVRGQLIRWRTSERARHLRVAVYAQGSVRLTVPSECDEDRALAFLYDHWEWVERARSRLLRRQQPVPFPRIPAAEYADTKKRAESVVDGLLQQYAPMFGVVYHRVSIKRMKTRWGSCSKQGNLNFNIHIIHLPPHLQEYLVVHEVCHLRELNHSAKFWSLVGMAVPRYLDWREELRRGYTLR